MITVDGEAVNPSDDNSDEDAVAKAVRAASLELKLCKALAALNPPHDLSACLHSRIIALLRMLKQDGTTDKDVTHPADLSDSDLKEVADIIRAFHALPAWKAKGLQSATGLRTTLGEYALDLAAELDARATRGG